jgi:hypothetical protein
MFLRDIANSTEIVLSESSKDRKQPKKKRFKRRGGGSMRKATAGALNAATSIGSALAKKSKLGPAEARLLFIVGITLFGFALLLIFFPRITTIPLIILLLLLAIPTLINAIQSYRKY